MDVFDLRENIVRDYREYISSFVEIQDARIQSFVEEQLNEGLLWPEPLLQLNPSFQIGRTIPELVQEGILDQRCERIFRIRKGTSDEAPLRLHKHQEVAIRVATSRENYVLTTGTGSGKSLSYIIPIVDHVLKRGTGRGIQAIIVYPMNALANSQLGELYKFVDEGFPDNRGPLRYARYTGQEGDEIRNEIRANPPDILLTNYVMLELLLTRPDDFKALMGSARELRYLVLDELHTYRGRQGADVAMLIRRVRNLIGNEGIQCIGTSATLATGNSFADQQEQVAQVASTFFGVEFKPENIIGETLERITPDPALDNTDLVAQIAAQIEQDRDLPDDFESFIQMPIAGWIESEFGLDIERPTKRLVRRIPTTISGNNGAASRLSSLSGRPQTECENYIRKYLLAGNGIQNPSTGFPVFAFRLHQFISPGDTVYASLEPPESRYITANYQKFVPGRKNEAILVPLVFCRECGQEYYCVNLQDNTSGRRIFAREFGVFQHDEDSAGAYLYINPNRPWPDDDEGISGRLPDEWLEEGKTGLKVRPNRETYVPRSVRLDALGIENGAGIECNTILTPFRFCLNCGVAYDVHSRSDYAKLSTLSSGGRSTSTTILSLSSIRYLQQESSLSVEARKLLSFTDNRQDAALQAGHFNDFIETSLLRSALYEALKVSDNGILRHDVLTAKVFEALALPMEAFALNPDIRYAGKGETEEALRNAIGYRVYRDLKRGWRVTTPNLEQSGLLQIEYMSLADLCSDEDAWEGKSPILANASPDIRNRIATVLLDYMRRELTIQVSYLEKQMHEQIRQRSSQYLIAPWAIDENETMETARTLYPRPRRAGDFGGNVYLSARGGFGQYLSRRDTFEEVEGRLSLVERDQIIRDLLDALYLAGIVEIVDRSDDEDGVLGYRLKAAAMLWKAGDGTKAYHDPIRVPRKSSTGGRTNPYFVRFYQSSLTDLKNLRAKEHTAQVPYQEREIRENDFRAGKLPILYCSPTMELGIDIAQLNVVNMRNVPPTPANYAQRSGRAGRSGQPALVLTYCAKGSPHDQYFFKRKERMVSGSVSPPRLDLSNDELIRAHMNAIWLTESKLQLGKTLKEIVDLTNADDSLPLQGRIMDALSNQRAIQSATERGGRILQDMEHMLSNTDWYSENWVQSNFFQIAVKFDEACQRWRDLYKAAQNQLDHANAIIRDPSRTQQDRQRADILHREAVNQLNLLMEERNIVQSDFYSYRYFASEGFLPGYNFPRLPLSAYIPARRLRTEDGDYLSRPRFLAISEFGPRSFVYHEGSKYIINRVIMRIGKAETGEESLATEVAKICQSCGYLHPIGAGTGFDLCERCGVELGAPISSLFRMQNVSTKRRDRINSDEEERFRLGYEIQTAVRFHQDNGDLHVQTAEVVLEDKLLAKISYGNSANIWRINVGWRRKKEEQNPGFLLDIDSGYWQRNESVEDDPEDPMGPRVQRVVPYVADRKNCLLFEPEGDLDPRIMATLATALKHAIQIEYQLEDSELAAEPLPSRDERKVILFYEASEGGAGVLRRLVEDNEALRSVAKRALQLCHFDPESGANHKHSDTSNEECEAACYDCLLSYYNQLDHDLFDRFLILPMLMEYAQAEIHASPNVLSREEYLGRLKNLCGSDLEKNWLEFIDSMKGRLPSAAQKLVESCRTRPDFLYEDDFTAIYVDGPHHEYPERQERDRAQQSCLEDLGYTIIRFGLKDDWEKIVNGHPHIFGISS